MIVRLLGHGSGRRWLVAMLAVVAFAVAPTQGFGYFFAIASPGSYGRSVAGSVNRATGLGLGTGGVTPTANPNVPLTWDAATLENGGPVGGYVLSRSDSSHQPQTVGAGCAGVIAVLACTESGVPDGEWRYSVQAKLHAWLGPESPTFDVKVDTTRPAITAGPTDPSNDPSPKFEFDHPTFSAFECRIDADPFKPCASGDSAAAMHGSSLADGSHTFAVEAVDADNYPTRVATYDWAIDTTPPSVSVTFPADGSAYNGPGWTAGSPIEGTATDAASGIAGSSAIALTVTQTATGKTWTGSSFESGAHTVAPTTFAGGAWAYTLPASAFSADGAYSVAVSAVDRAGNTGGPATRAFTYDSTPPTAALGFPAADGFYGTATWDASGAITGSASDGAGAGVAQVKIAIQDGGGAYYDGAGFESPTVTYLPASGTTAWSYPIASDKLTDGHTYHVTVETVDAATAANTDPAAATANFDFDSAAPTATIAFPAATFYNSAGWGGSAGAVSGTASDNGGAGVGSVSVSVRDTTSAKCADASGAFTVDCDANDSFEPTSGTPSSWSFGIPAESLTDGDSYAVVVRTTDTLGNTESSAATAGWSYDTTAPSASLALAGTPPAGVFLGAPAGDVYDLFFNGSLSNVQFSLAQSVTESQSGLGTITDPGFGTTPTGWQALAAVSCGTSPCASNAYEWTSASPATPPDQAFTAGDAAGNASTPQTVHFVNDPTAPDAPTMTVLPPSIAEGQSLSVTSAADNAGGSGIASVTYYYCAGSGCTPDTPIIPSGTTGPGYSTTWTGLPADGTYEIAARATDHVGNTSSLGAAQAISIGNVQAGSLRTAAAAAALPGLGSGLSLVSAWIPVRPARAARTRA